MLPRATTRSFVDNLLHDTLTELSAAGAPSLTGGDLRTVACMITHGMGQQVPFETCATLAEAFARGERPMLRPPEANRVQLTPGGPILARMELCYAPTDTSPETHVHIYEGYWAPLTAGKISAFRTLLFLIDAGCRGLWTTVRRTRTASGRSSSFARWVFGDLRDFSIKRHTASSLVWAIVFIVLGVFCAVKAEHELRRLLFAAYFTWNHENSFHASVADLWRRYTGHKEFCIVHTMALFAETGWLLLSRYFLMEFVGDVVIYVSSYKVSEFQRIRDEISARVLAVGQQICSAKNSDGTQPLYDRLVFAGHSLGSVITYDLVNALITWDSTECHPSHDVQGRLASMLTFGSPLDKTAFLFRTQVSPEHHYREAMAANMQPLILDYTFRSFPWVNLHSRMDPVSGALVYYDWPEDPSAHNTIQNKIDPSARIPAVAHTQYWGGKMLTDELHAAICR